MKREECSVLGVQQNVVIAHDFLTADPVASFVLCRHQHIPTKSAGNVTSSRLLEKIGAYRSPAHVAFRVEKPSRSATHGIIPSEANHDVVRGRDWFLDPELTPHDGWKRPVTPSPVAPQRKRRPL